jgi:hypothetical protein
MIFFDSRTILSLTRVPGFPSTKLIVLNVYSSCTGFPSTARMRSPGLSPDFAAGEFANVSIIVRALVILLKDILAPIPDNCPETSCFNSVNSAHSP